MAPVGGRMIEVQRLFHEGKLGEALETLIGEKLPLDIFEAFFPPNDGRQDLVNWLTVRERLLAPHQAAFRRAERALIKAVGPSPTGVEAALRAYCSIFLDDYDAAVCYMKGAIQSPRPWVYFMQALCLWLKSANDRSRELMPDALSAIDISLEQDPKNVYAYYVRSGLRRELENVVGRLADCEMILKLRPDFVWARVERAETWGETNQFSKANRELNILIRQHPRAAWSWAQRGRLFGIYSRHRLAIKDFSRAVRLDPDCGPIYAWRGEAWRRLGEYEKAINDFNASLAIDPTYRLGNLWRGRTRLLLGNYRAALIDLRRAVELEPREQLASAWHAEALWKLGRCREAALGFDGIYPAEPQNTWNRLLREGQTQELGFAIGKNDMRKSRDLQFMNDLNEILRTHSTDPWAWAFRGRCRAAKGMLKEALADLIRALQLNASLSYAYRWRGEVLRRMGARQMALGDLNQALKLDPSDRWASCYRALVRGDIGDVVGGMADFKKALSAKEPRFAVAYLWRGEWLHSLGMVAEARLDFETAFILDGKDPRILEWRKRLERPK